MFRRAGLIFSVFLFTFVSFSLTAFAEGEVVCSGKMMGITNSADPNGGQNYFDSHESFDPEGNPYPDANKTTNLSIVGLSDGFAPKEREMAACVDYSGPIEPDKVDQNYEAQGWAWNDNLGFVSFYCGGGTNPSVDIDSGNGVTPPSCGAISYGVTIGPEVAGVRQLSGYAWNEGLGYIEFEDPNPGVGVEYGVKLDSLGNVTGFAWTEAGVWMDFTGLKIQLPGEDIELPVDDYCGDLTLRPLCMTISPDPDNFFGFDNIGTAHIADGVDEYVIDLYLMDTDGVTPLNLANVVVDFSWIDTVKTNQLSGATGNFSGVSTAAGGAVLYKPIHVDATNFASIFDTVSPGHYRLKSGVTTIRSVAPTSNENVSLTTSTEPAFVVNNESFFTNIPGVTTLPIQPNILVLQSVSVKVGAVAKPPIFPNGKDGANLRFRPAIELSTLFANDREDSILGIRGIPTTYKVGATESGSLNAVGKNVNMYLAYDENETITTGDCTVEEAGNFSMTFLKDLAGEVYEIGQGPTSSVVSVASLLTTKEISSVATLNVEGETPCNQAQGPSLYSIINYSQATKGAVRYFSNKLPKIATEIANPAVVVHGNIFASSASSPSAEQPVQESGSPLTSGIRDTINSNITLKLPGFDLTPSLGGATRSCTITGLGASVSASCPISYYTSSVIEGQNVVTFKGADVTFDLVSRPTADWTVVVAGGNIFIDDDIYSATVQKNLAIVAFGPHSAGCYNKGNIYISSDVTNIQANIFADCSVFSYKAGNKAYGTGLDRINNTVAGKGLYQWASTSDMINSLNKQLVVEGSIASFNTVGGADSDELGYLRNGFGEVYELPTTSEQRMEAQQYDLNYLRLFKLKLETNESGLPRDFRCDKYLSIEEILAIREDPFGHGIIGENGEFCDGIQLVPFSESGDLVPPMDQSTLAQGLTDTDFDPIYVFFDSASSFLFGKK